MVRTFSTGIIISLVAVLTLFVSSAMAETKLGGSVNFRDDGANAGAKLVTSLTGLDAGIAYEGQLWSADGQSSVDVGALTIAVDGSASNTYVDPDGASLQGNYDHYVIVDPSGSIIYSDSIPSIVSDEINSVITTDALGLRDTVAAALVSAKAANSATTLSAQQTSANEVLAAIDAIVAHADGVIAAADLIAVSAAAELDVAAAAKLASSNAADARTGALQAQSNATALVAATSISDYGSKIQAQNLEVGLSNANDSARLAYGNAQDMAAFVPVLGASPVFVSATPAVGDSMVPSAAWMALILGFVLIATGGVLATKRQVSS